jgi:hypothetical protein
MARPSARREKSRGDTKADAPRPYGVKEEGHCSLATATWRLKDSGYATLPGSNGERDLRRLGVIGRERHKANCAGLRSDPAFLMKRTE